MNYLKTIIKRLIKYFFNIILLIDLRLLRKNKNTIVFDIDNTLADTWQSLKPKNIINFRNEKERMLSLSLINGANDLVTHSSTKFDQIIFLSARNPLHYFVTKKWIDTNFGLDDYKLRLVPNVNMKQHYWKKIIQISSKTVIIDDLSFNHENNEVKFYINEIKFLTSFSSIKYFGYNDIKDGLSNIQNKL